MRTISACRRVALMALMVLASARAQAADGVIEINHVCAVQTGCLPGDGAGYPVTIDQSGAYRLTSNLVQPNAATSVVVMTADHVSLDLGGFEIGGPFTCAGAPSTCSVAGNGYAISALSSTGVEIRNGTIQGTARGINVGPHCIVEGLRVIETTYVGITALAGCAVSRVLLVRNGNIGLSLAEGTVRDSVASENVLSGFVFSSGVVITGSASHGNGQAGILGSLGTQVSNCTVKDNGTIGISLGDSSVVTSSASRNNASHGIAVGAGGVVRFSAALGNGGAGIFVGVGSQATGNSSRGNVGAGLVLRDGGSYRETAFTGNNGGIETQVVPNSGTDTIFNLGSNVCGSDTVCP